MSAVSPHSYFWHWCVKRPWKQARSSNSCGFPRWRKWVAKAKHRQRSTRKHRMCSGFKQKARGQPAPGPGLSQARSKNPTWTSQQLCLVTSSAFWVPICKWPCWLETLYHIQKWSTHILLLWDAGNVGAMVLDRWLHSETVSGTGILAYFPSQPADLVACFLHTSSYSRHVHLLVFQLRSFPQKNDKRNETLLPQC